MLPPPPPNPSYPSNLDKNCALFYVMQKLLYMYIKTPTFFTVASCSLCFCSRSSLRSFSCSALCFSSRIRLNLADKKRALITAWSLVIPLKTFETMVKLSKSRSVMFGLNYTVLKFHAAYNNHRHRTRKFFKLSYIS